MLLLKLLTSLFQVRLFLISSSGFSLSRSLHGQQSRVLCLAWKNNGEHIVIGGTDSTIRVIHVFSATCTSRITLDDHIEKTNPVWDVKFIGDTSIVSANSVGKVQIWDFKTGTLQNTFSQHSADVLALAVQDRQGANVVFSSGVDSAIVKLCKESGERSMWIPTGKIRPHQHDVFSLHLSSNGMLASGGVEGELVITNTSQLFSNSGYVKYQPFPCMSRHFKIAKAGGILLCQGISSIHLWRISNCISEPCGLDNSDEMDSAEKCAPRCLLELKNNPPRNLLSSCISTDGSTIAISDTYEVWVYKFIELGRKASLISNFPYPSFSMLFTPNQQSFILATTTEGLKIVTFDEGGHYAIDALSNDTTFKELVISSDGYYLAALTEHWRIFLFDVRSSTCISKLPKFEALPTVMHFNPSKPELVVFAGGQCRKAFVYHLEKNDLHCLGRIRGTKNEYFQGRAKLSHPLSIAPITFERNLFCVYDNDCVMLFRTENKRGAVDQHSNVQYDNPVPVQLVKTASLVIFVGVFDNQDKTSKHRGLILVERSQRALLQSLPPTLYRKRFGI